MIEHGGWTATRDVRAVRYRDRSEAGRTLATHLSEYSGGGQLVVLGLPRGGVPVAFEVARGLRAPLDVFVVRKLGVPWQPELAMGAIAAGGVTFLNSRVVDELRIDEREIDAVVQIERAELERREHIYRGSQPPLEVGDKVVIVVDDGLATGSSMRAAVEALRRLGPREIVVAVPVASDVTCRELAAVADRVVCASAPEPFYAVGLWYDDFRQIDDEEIRSLLAAAAAPTDEPGRAGTS
ncbi:MAG: phosphoribosyltransferase [Actinomycetota bacterium]